MSLLQEIEHDTQLLLKNFNCDIEKVNEFEQVSGLDLSDLLYKLDCCLCFENWLKNGEVDKSVYGFEYDYLRDNLQHSIDLHGALWVERHTHTPTEEEETRLHNLYEEAWAKARKNY